MRQACLNDDQEVLYHNKTLLERHLADPNYHLLISNWLSVLVHLLISGIACTQYSDRVSEAVVCLKVYFAGGLQSGTGHQFLHLTSSALSSFLLQKQSWAYCLPWNSLWMTLILSRYLQHAISAPNQARLAKFRLQIYPQLKRESHVQAFISEFAFNLLSTAIPCWTSWFAKSCLGPLNAMQRLSENCWSSRDYVRGCELPLWFFWLILV